MMQLSINNVNVTFASYQELLELIEKAIHHSGVPQFIGYVNANTIILSDVVADFRTALNSHTISYADGVGMHLAAKMLQHHPIGFVKNHNATDFNEALLRYANTNGLKVFFLGTTKESLSKLGVRLKERFPGIINAGMCDGYDGINDETLVHRVNASGADILFVGMGNPKQEIWLYERKSVLKIPVCVTVGAFLDFVSGEIQRAPLVFRMLRIEWLFRLAQEPRRLWRRYILGIPKFLVIIARQIFQA